MLSATTTTSLNQLTTLFFIRGIRMEFPDELFRVGEISVGNGTVDFPYC